VKKKIGPPPSGPPPGIPASVPLPTDWKFADTEVEAVRALNGAAAHEESDGWVFDHDMANDIKVYTRANEDGSAGAVCGQAYVQASPMVCIGQAGDVENWKAWDALLKGAEFKQLTAIHRVYHLTFFFIFSIRRT